MVAVEVELQQHAATANGESVSFKLSSLSSIVAMFTRSGSSSCISLPMTQWTPPSELPTPACLRNFRRRHKYHLGSGENAAYNYVYLDQGITIYQSAMGYEGACVSY